MRTLLVFAILAAALLSAAPGVRAQDSADTDKTVAAETAQDDDTESDADDDTLVDADDADDDIFLPSEEIKADSEISFPSDI